MIQGRRHVFSELQKAISHNQSPLIWFHCASLGEFEQGRPVMEALKQKHPSYKILLTFFSPSGYEIRKNYSGADWIFYLPFDTAANAKKFLNIAQPKFVFFVKYEFWFYYLRELQARNIPTILISAIFRPNQIFFQWYGKFIRKILNTFDSIFLQDKQSEILLKNIGINKSVVAGDTRFDRVHAQLSMVTPLPMIEAFKKDHLLLIAGSAWEEDMRLLIPLINQSPTTFRFIIAPHEIHSEQLMRWQAEIQKYSQLYSEVVRTGECKADTSVLFIDSIGLLSSIYRYGNFAHVGGAFGKGLHNILEAATFGMPISFGPNIQKFPEAKSLIEEGAAKAVHNYDELSEFFQECMTPETNQKKSELARAFVQKNRGATNTIMSHISPQLN